MAGKSRVFRYYNPEYRTFDNEGKATRVALVPTGLRDARDLLTLLGEELDFPRYYGKNLDAFWDCVTGLENIAAHRVLVVHGDLPALPADRRAAYLEVLADAVAYWADRRAEHVFEAWFPAEVEPDIKALVD